MAVDVRIAGILRKSPTKKTEESKQIQKKAILTQIKRDYPNKIYKVDWFFDIAKGDSANRPNLQKFFNKHEQYNYAYALNVDRFSRSWLGIKWFHEYFTGNSKPQLRFCYEVPNLYYADGEINADSYMILFIMCGFAQAELLRIRKRIKDGIDRIKKDPKLRAEKYKGGSKGRKWQNGKK